MRRKKNTDRISIGVSSKSTARVKLCAGTDTLFVFVKTFARVYARFPLVDVTFKDFCDAPVERSRVGGFGTVHCNIVRRFQADDIEDLEGAERASRAELPCQVDGFYVSDFVCKQCFARR